MSKIARWSYKYKATVTPFLGENGVTGEIDYGPAYEIACNIIGMVKQESYTAANGRETVGTHTIYTEDPRPKKGDMIEFAGVDGQQEILDWTLWEMAAFKDTPDYKLVT